MPVIILKTLAAVLAVIYLGLVTKSPSMVRSVVKTGSVLLLSVAALMTDAPMFVAVALGLCALGDFFLSRDGERAFLAGVASFALGHIAYVVGFLWLPASDFSQLATPAAALICVVLLIMGVGMARVLAPRAGELKPAVLAYIPIILSMGIAALTLPSSAYPWVHLAAFAFILSDLVLAFETFVLPPGHKLLKVTPFVIWPFYWGAQAGFLLSFT
ncbi:MAG: lysoplasmalogenase [Paracoccaceae bacterium]